eukprot:CAMPEP_0197589370 /NCGR_PEP_ID=MMETSP1326-20131121/10343_1 /TAXON_ID=1155430 /ORGANISM="Genus nov. species nov., Strain RCC2288" /LENGTH=214 /DNA_ID=CAMNT_0043154301 /DNA_START=55 /DNA_END=699 /DNA_ORIENTATION=+
MAPSAAPPVLVEDAVASKEMCFACFDYLVAHFTGARLLPPSYSNHSCPLFVSWENVSELGNGAPPRLRGCIGSLTPRHLHGGLHEYALHSGVKDGRFHPIELRELPALECKVSLLSCYEVAANYLDWEVGIHGLIIEFLDDSQRSVKRSATYLPDIARQEGWTKLEAIDSLIRKAGFRGSITDALRASLQTTRYQSTASKATYGEYLGARQLAH